jgi:hypothetical protein
MCIIRHHYYVQAKMLERVTGVPKDLSGGNYPVVRFYGSRPMETPK